MKHAAIALTLIGTGYCLIGSSAMSELTPGPVPIGTVTPIAAPLDTAYPGSITLSVDATDTQRRIVHVEEHLTGLAQGAVLLFPKWLPGNHSHTGPVERLVGLRVSADGRPIAWTRDAVEMHAFHLSLGARVTEVDVSFDYLSPTAPNIDPVEMSTDLAVLDWNELLLYPAGYYARRIPVTAALRLPARWQHASALEVDGAAAGEVRFKRTDLETLMDSPVYAGRYSQRFDLVSDAGVPPVALNVFADRPELLAAKPEYVAAYRSLVTQANRLFASHHYSHYDFLYALSDQVHGKGLEHHQSSENTVGPGAFTDWDKASYSRDLLAHEYTHSWNGKFRRPADLWTPNYNVPMQGSLLWVYEGQTEYWGDVLAARSGLWTKQQALDQLALVASYYQLQSGREWRSLQDTTNDPVINHHHPTTWENWSRYKDYYDEGLLIWLDVDTLIRERSQGKRSLDDFARSFFGINDGSRTVVTYTFDDLVRALNAIEPYAWAPFLRERLDGVGKAAPLDGLQRGGYRLVFTDTPSDFQKDADAKHKQCNLLYTIGATIDNDGSVGEVVWNQTAFKAGLTSGTQILAVNGLAYDADVLTDAITAAKTSHAPIQLIVKTGERYRVVAIEYFDGLRYPHLVRDAALPARLDDILTAKP
jgi:predicted metalloprotease with PDZ domain